MSEQYTGKLINLEQEMTEIDVPDQYKYVLQRYDFEVATSTDNLAFVLGTHLDDEDDSFIGSPLYNRLIDRCVETLCSMFSAEVGVVEILSEQPATKWEYKNGYSTLFVGA